MRELKFRAWNGRNMIMPATKAYYQAYLSFCGHIIQTCSEGMHCMGGGDKWRREVGLSLMQYTGLKDKEGAELYEDDVCNVEGLGLCVVAICPMYGAIFKTKDGQEAPLIDCDAESDLYEKVGDIHQNPELLK